ncbi:MAG: hypothetical protein U0518_05090 [Candidatus Gracilibacteria bacterium]
MTISASFFGEFDESSSRVIQVIYLPDWTSEYSLVILNAKFRLGDGKCSVWIPNIDTDDFIIITGVHQPEFRSMYGPLKGDVSTIYFRCIDVSGQTLAVDNPVCRLMRHHAHQSLDKIYKE